jgi:hypothetical protein
MTEQLLRDVVPASQGLALLVNPANRKSDAISRELQAAARALA